MSSTKLKHAPLKEVIFELYWECAMDSVGIQYDAGFDLAQGKFAEKIKASFPVHKKLIPDGVPLEVFGAPMHQYWQGEFEWPVVQHGQGMLAVNEVENGYEWENAFKPLVIKSIEGLVDSYENNLTFNRIKLQYIDAWDLSGLRASDFTSNYLQTEIRNSYELPGELKGFNIQQNFDINNGSVMNLNIFTGLNNKNEQPSVIWTTSVERRSKMDFAEVVAWLENAHEATSTMFKKMLNPDFYASLDR